MVGWCRLGGILSKWASTLFLSSTALCSTSIYFQGDLWTWLFDWQVGDTSYNTDVDKSALLQLYHMSCILLHCSVRMVFIICLYVIITQVSTDLYIQSSHNVSQSCVMYAYNSHVYGCWTKNRGKTPKMDGENNWTPYWNGWFGGTIILETPICYRL